MVNKDTMLRKTPYLSSRIIKKLNVDDKIVFIEYLDTNKAWSYVKTYDNQIKGWCLTDDLNNE